MSGLQVSDDEIRRFMEQKYPQYKDNLELGRLLYAKHVGAVVSRVGEVVDVRVKDLFDGSLEGRRVRLKGLLGSLEVYEYHACPKCFKKKCSCAVPSGEQDKVVRYRYKGIVGDETGCIGVTIFGEKELGLEVGEEYLFIGVLKKSYDGEGNIVYFKGQPVYELLANEFQRLSGAVSQDVEAVSKVVEFVRKAKKVDLKVFKKICEKYGVSEDDVLKHLVVDGGVVMVRE